MLTLQIHSRPGYWRTLAWSAVLAIGALKGRTTVRGVNRVLYHEYHKHGSTLKAHPKLALWIMLTAIGGVRPRMEETDDCIRLSIYKIDQQGRRFREVATQQSKEKH